MFRSNDSVTDFIDACLVNKPGNKIEFSTVHKKYRDFCEKEDLLKLKCGDFKEALKKRSIQIKRSSVYVITDYELSNNTIFD